MTCEDTNSATSLQASEGGVTHFDSLDGPMTDLFGQEVVLASPSVPQESSVAQRMKDTYGLRSSASSSSVALAESLANRLPVLLESRGSTMFALTWKMKVTPQRRRLCQLVASVQTTKENGSIGVLPTPSGTSNNGKNHVAGRLDEWGGSSNRFRGTSLGPMHLPGFELWVMGFPDAWRQLMPPVMPSSRKSQKHS